MVVREIALSPDRNIYFRFLTVRYAVQPNTTGSATRFVTTTGYLQCLRQIKVGVTDVSYLTSLYSQLRVSSRLPGSCAIRGPPGTD